MTLAEEKKKKKEKTDCPDTKKHSLLGTRCTYTSSQEDKRVRKAQHSSRQPFWVFRGIVVLLKMKQDINLFARKFEESERAGERELEMGKAIETKKERGAEVPFYFPLHSDRHGKASLTRD